MFEVHDSITVLGISCYLVGNYCPTVGSLYLLFRVLSGMHGEVAAVAPTSREGCSRQISRKVYGDSVAKSSDPLIHCELKDRPREVRSPAARNPLKLD